MSRPGAAKRESPPPLAAGPPAPEARASRGLTATERHRVVVEWNDTAREAPPDCCIHELFEAQVELTPDAPAVCGQERVTYSQLDAQANRLAHRLRSCGVGPEVLAGVFMDCSPAMLASLLAVLKAGGAYVPLDPGYPEERLAAMVADCAVPVVIAQQALLPRLAAMPGRRHLVTPDGAGAEIPGPSGVHPDNPAYAIYTSGSTGRPKAVIVSHRSLVASTLARLELYGSTPPAVALLLPSFAFDSSVAVIFGTLCQGGTLVLPREEQRTEVRELAALIQRHAVSDLLVLPALYGLLLEQAEPCHLASLRRVMVAGEAPAASLPERHAAALPGAELFNEYGPTEATVWTSVQRCRRDECRAAVPMGRPIANWQVYLLDRRLEPVPAGETGEIHIGGAGIARGYLNRTGLTAERFIPDPFGRLPGRRLYRTGDLARWLPDGRLEFLGRADQQVKIRGFRVELGEIEAALVGHTAVRAAALTVERLSAGHPRLVAYLVLDGGPGCERPSRAELQAFLRRQLPEHMVPARLLTLDALPLSPNGKLDRGALTSAGAATLREVPYRQPHDQVEATIADVWQQVLEVEPIGVDDNLFDHGGDSILAIRIAMRLREFGLAVDVGDLWNQQTIDGLARLLRARGEATVAAPEAPAAGRFATVELDDEELAAIFGAAAT